MESLQWPKHEGGADRWIERATSATCRHDKRKKESPKFLSRRTTNERHCRQFEAEVDVCSDEGDEETPLTGDGLNGIEVKPRFNPFEKRRGRWKLAEEGVGIIGPEVSSGRRAWAGNRISISIENSR